MGITTPFGSSGSGSGGGGGGGNVSPRDAGSGLELEGNALNALLYPRHKLLKGGYTNSGALNQGDTVAGACFMYSASNTQIQNGGAWTAAKTARMDFESAAKGQDPSAPSTPTDAVDWTEIMEKASSGQDNAVISFNVTESGYSGQASFKIVSASRASGKRYWEISLGEAFGMSGTLPISGISFDIKVSYDRRQLVADEISAWDTIPDTLLGETATALLGKQGAVIKGMTFAEARAHLGGGAFIDLGTFQRTADGNFPNANNRWARSQSANLTYISFRVDDSGSNESHLNLYFKPGTFIYLGDSVTIQLTGNRSVDSPPGQNHKNYSSNFVYVKGSASDLPAISTNHNVDIVEYVSPSQLIYSIAHYFTGATVDTTNQLITLAYAGHISDTAPSQGLFEGYQWYDKGSNILKIYDGAAWHAASGFSHKDYPEGVPVADDKMSFVDVSDSDKTKLAKISEIEALGVTKELFTDFAKTDIIGGTNIGAHPLVAYSNFGTPTGTAIYFRTSAWTGKPTTTGTFTAALDFLHDSVRYCVCSTSLDDQVFKYVSGAWVEASFNYNGAPSTDPAFVYNEWSAQRDRVTILDPATTPNDDLDDVPRVLLFHGRSIYALYATQSVTPAGDDLVEYRADMLVLPSDAADGDIAQYGSDGWESEAPSWPDAEDTVPFAASFRDAFSRTFKTGSLNTALNGEALVSSGNNVPSGAPGGTTDFVVIDVNNSGGNSERTGLAKVAVGDWLRAKRGGKFIIAKIQHINEDTPNDAYEFWFNPSTAIDETLQYDSLGTGAGEIRFYRQTEEFEVGGGAPAIGDIIRRTSTGWEKYTPSKADAIGSGWEYVIGTGDVDKDASKTLTAISGSVTVDSAFLLKSQTEVVLRVTGPLSSFDNRVVGLVVTLVHSNGNIHARQWIPNLFVGGSASIQKIGRMQQNASNKVEIYADLNSGTNFNDFTLTFSIDQDSTNALQNWKVRIQAWVQGNIALADKINVHEVATGTPALSDKLLGSDESETGDPNFAPTIEDVLALGKPQERAHLENVSETFTNLGDALTADDIVRITFYAAVESGGGGGSDTRTIEYKVGSLKTSAQWVGMKGGRGGARFEIKRTSGYQIQVRRQGPISSTDNDVYLFY